MAGIQSGRLNRKIDFYRQVSTKSRTGQMVHTYTFDFSAMSAVYPMRGNERTKHEREEMATMLFKFKTYFNPRVSVTHKIKFDGNFFDIQGFAPMGSMNRRVIEFTGELIDASKVVLT